MQVLGHRSDESLWLAPVATLRLGLLDWQVHARLGNWFIGGAGCIGGLLDGGGEGSVQVSHVLEQVVNVPCLTVSTTVIRSRSHVWLQSGE